MAGGATPGITHRIRTPQAQRPSWIKVAQRSAGSVRRHRPAELRATELGNFMILKLLWQRPHFGPQVMSPLVIQSWESNMNLMD